MRMSNAGHGMLGGVNRVSGQERERRHSGAWVRVVGLAVVLCVQAAFVLSYVGALHDPKPHGVPLGVVGTSKVPAAVATHFSLRITRFPSESAAEAAIDKRKVDGALLSGPGADRLIVVPASGVSGALALSSAFGTAAAALGQKLEIVQLHKLPAGDAGGNVSFLVVMALIVGGYLAATIAMVFGGSATRRGRLAMLALAAVAGALLTDLVAGPVLHALPSSKFLVLWGLFVLVMLGVAYSTSALQAVLGGAGTIVVVVLFVIFGAPASGGTVPSPYLPGIWRTVGPYLPAGAGTTAVRNTIYFDGNGINRSLIVLAAYLILGSAALIVVRRRQTTATAAELEASAAATVVV
jgi:hypothetical protein